jgi:hypothetical protein
MDDKRKAANLLLVEFTMDQQRQAREIGRRSDEITLDERIEIVERLVSDYSTLRDMLVALRDSDE